MKRIWIVRRDSIRFLRQNQSILRHSAQFIIILKTISPPRYCSFVNSLPHFPSCLWGSLENACKWTASSFSALITAVNEISAQQKWREMYRDQEQWTEKGWLTLLLWVWQSSTMAVFELGSQIFSENHPFLRKCEQGLWCSVGIRAEADIHHWNDRYRCAYNDNTIQASSSVVTKMWKLCRCLGLEA